MPASADILPGAAGDEGDAILAFGSDGAAAGAGRTLLPAIRDAECIGGQDASGNATSFDPADDVSAISFAAGTRIMTSLGEVAVEDLRGGDLVVTLSGHGEPLKPVLWVGRRRVQLAGNPAAAALRPVLVRAGALGRGTPRRDLLVSPDHCLFLDGVLVPARLLVNGRSILTERRGAEITYHHVELEAHDVLLAEGAAAESWLDTGNRAWFENAASPRPDAAAPPAEDGTGWHPTRGCAPLVLGGARLAAIRAAIEARAPTVAAPTRNRTD